MVDGHELHEEDLRLMYTFDQNSSSAARYEAHSDSQVGGGSTSAEISHGPKYWDPLCPYQVEAAF